MNTDLIEYYKARAKEYEDVYLKPERQEDLKVITSTLQNSFAGKTIFEVGCGTGFWTEKISITASSILAIDANESLLEIARHKDYHNASVSFDTADFYSYQSSKKYEGVFAGFIWSHIQLQDLANFLKKIHQFVLPGGKVVFIDNNYVEGSSQPISRTDENDNTFQNRILKDGSVHLIRKNFPTESFIREKLKGFTKEITYLNLKYFWILIYTPAD